MSLHSEDYARGASAIAEWFRARPKLGLILVGIAAGAIITLMFTLG